MSAMTANDDAPTTNPRAEHVPTAAPSRRLRHKIVAQHECGAFPYGMSPDVLPDAETDAGAADPSDTVRTGHGAREWARVVKLTRGGPITLHLRDRMRGYVQIRGAEGSLTCERLVRDRLALFSASPSWVPGDSCLFTKGTPSPSRGTGR